MTALVILLSGYVTIDAGTGLMAIKDGLGGAALTTQAFDSAFPGFGGFIVTFGLIFFAFSTILGWYYYGSKSLEYIAGVKAVEYYKYIWVALAFFGAIYKVDLVWSLSDTFNGLMAIPNLIGLLALSPVIFKLLKQDENKNRDKEKKLA